MGCRLHLGENKIFAPKLLLYNDFRARNLAVSHFEIAKMFGRLWGDKRTLDRPTFSRCITFVDLKGILVDFRTIHQETRFRASECFYNSSGSRPSAAAIVVDNGPVLDGRDLGKTCFSKLFHGVANELIIELRGRGESLLGHKLVITC